MAFTGRLSSPMLPCGQFSGMPIRHPSVTDITTALPRVTFFILISGISVFWDWNSAGFVAACKSDPADWIETRVQTYPYLQTSAYPSFSVSSLATSCGIKQRW